MTLKLLRVLVPVTALATAAGAWAQSPAPGARATSPPRQADAAGPTTTAAPAGEATDTAPAAEGAPQPPGPARTLSPPAAETAYRQKVKALIAPLLAIAPSDADIRQLKDALKSRSPEAAQSIGEPAARKLVLWQALKAGLGEPEDFVRFAAANPAWPDSQLLLRRAEEQLFTRGGASNEIRGFFKGREPVSGAGWAALASAHLAEGDEAAARQHAQRAWTDEEMAATLEPGFLDRFGKLLGTADHQRRVDRILVDRIRSAAERRERAQVARRVLPLLPEAERKVAEARLAAFLKDKKAPALLAALPAEAGDWGLAFARAADHLDNRRHTEAAKILTRLPDDGEKLVSADDWWLLRRDAAFAALTAGKADLAYELVRTAGPLSVNPLKEQAHMAGWVALRMLGKPDIALRHFDAGVKAADGPLSRARSAYWSARALEALGKKREARERYTLAMRDPDTFHGLLSRQLLAGAKRGELQIEPPKMPTAAEAERLIGLDSARAAVLASKAGLDRNIVIGLFAALRNHLKTEGEMALLAELAASLGDPQTSLRVGKAAIAKGLNLLLYAYPIDPFPEYEPLRPPPETALLLAVARQETEFNTQIVSHAGARGLLQVMPITAKHVCIQHKVKCDIPRLLTDHAYNARIASAYIADRMSELGGWYTVSLAAYNAGPGRARQWIRELGDPRGSQGVDAIDWIERIPIEETRQYVEKVLSNIQVYRARLGVEKPLRLIEDLTSATGIRREVEAR